jgi:hypothetical protein
MGSKQHRQQAASAASRTGSKQHRQQAASAASRTGSKQHRQQAERAASSIGSNRGDAEKRNEMRGCVSLANTRR